MRFSSTFAISFEEKFEGAEDLESNTVHWSHPTSFDIRSKTV